MCVVIVVGDENSPSAVAVRSDCTNGDATEEASDDAEDAEQQNAGKY